MTTTEQPAGVRVEQLVEYGEGGKWHAPATDGIATACGLYPAEDAAVANVDEVPVPERCQAPACRALWTGEAPVHAGPGVAPSPRARPAPSADAAPLDEKPPLDDVDTEGGDRPLNPVESEAAIRKVARLVWTGVRVVTDAEQAFLDADRTYEHAFAKAYLEYRGPAHAKKYAATLATEQERLDRDVAELAFNRAKNLQKAKLVSLDAVRSVNTSVREMYRADSGVGR